MTSMLDLLVAIDVSRVTVSSLNEAVVVQVLMIPLFVIYLNMKNSNMTVAHIVDGVSLVSLYSWLAI